jgi:hypothetical protein
VINNSIKNIKGRFTILVVCFLTLMACHQDDAMRAKLHGKWQVVSAERNGRSTSTLEDAYFHFENDSILSTNILRKDISVSYEVHENQIIQGGTPSMTYNIDELLGDSLILSSRIKDYDFKFYLVRDTIKSLPLEAVRE